MFRSRITWLDNPRAQNTAETAAPRSALYRTAARCVTPDARGLPCISARCLGPYFLPPPPFAVISRGNKSLHASNTHWPACSFEYCGVVDISTCAAAGGSGDVITSDSTVALDDTSATTSDRALPTTTDSSATAATDDTSSSTTTPECQAAIDECRADSACFACAGELAEADAAAEACFPPGFDPATVTCSENLEAFCCFFQEHTTCLAEPNDVIDAWLGGGW